MNSALWYRLSFLFSPKVPLYLVFSWPPSLGKYQNYGNWVPWCLGELNWFFSKISTAIIAMRFYGIVKGKWTNNLIASQHYDIVRLLLLFKFILCLHRISPGSSHVLALTKAPGLAIDGIFWENIIHTLFHFINYSVSSFTYSIFFNFHYLFHYFMIDLFIDRLIYWFIYHSGLFILNFFISLFIYSFILYSCTY